MRSREFEIPQDGHDNVIKFERKMEEIRREFPDTDLETDALLTDFQMTIESTPEAVEKIQRYRDEHGGADPSSLNLAIHREGIDILYSRANSQGVRVLSVQLIKSEGEDDIITSRLEGIEIAHYPERQLYTTSIHGATIKIADGKVHVDQDPGELLTPSSRSKLQEGRDFLRRVETLLYPQQAPLDLPWAA